MSAASLFIVGCLVTLIVAAALALLIYAAIPDGRDAGGAQTLLDGGPYTLFAPSDEAFAKLPDGVVESLLVSPQTLANVLSYHVVPGRMTAAEVAAQRSAPTVQGEDLPVSHNDAIRVDGARVVTGDIEATNGLIHVIDRVLLPARI